MIVSIVTAMGSQPGAADAYLMLTKSAYLRTELTSKLRTTNRAILNQRIRNAKLRQDIFKLLHQQQAADGSQNHKDTKLSKRMDRFRRFHN